MEVGHLLTKVSTANFSNFIKSVPGREYRLFLMEASLVLYLLCSQSSSLGHKGVLRWLNSLGKGTSFGTIASGKELNTDEATS